MTALPTRGFQSIVQSIVAGIQGRASDLIDFSKGSPLLAIAEGFTAVFLWFQALALQLLTAARLSTAQGTDVDTFAGDFQVYRLGAAAASGTVIFSRFTAAPAQVFIPVGTQVQTGDGTQTFAVTADPTYVTYSATTGGYMLPANTGSITVPAQALVPGTGGNVSANTITNISSAAGLQPLIGLDTVTNPSAFTNGINSESDAALKTRFAAFILGLSRGDYYGTEYAVLSVQATIQWTLTEAYDYGGNFAPGTYYVVADDGSGSPSASFISGVRAAANTVRPLGNFVSVFAPIVDWLTISMQIQTAAGYDHGTVVGLVSQAIQNGVNALGLGNGLPYSLVGSWAYSVTGVTSVSDIVVNGLQGDAANIAANNQVSLKCNTAIVS
jgi:hypothetical protein